ncbi:DUF340 domain-containing protein [Acidaminococcus massiliensis]|jgi:hypothetical protein|uniref:DUF340 domain-containing protein n=1 Tax=Acidaminococcus massiliensis TaxID=1852375 RepID=UPI0022E84A72|nr:DUF340 domain-containing protein [Acidaminococcus massiliensis]
MRTFTLPETTLVLIITAFLSLVANALSSNIPFLDAVPGMVILIAISLAGIIAARVLPGGIPAVAYITTLGCILTYPGFPGSEIVNMYMKKVGFLALCTPILAYAGISIGKDMDAFKKTGWRIVVLACVIFIGTYLGSAVIAEVILKALGQI